MNDKPGIAARDAALEALHAAAAQASKPGVKTSECWLNIGAGAVGALAIALAPTPFGLIIAGALSAGAAAYAVSRGSLKKALGAAAVDALAGVAAGVPGPIGDAAKVAGGVVSSAIGTP